MSCRQVAVTNNFFTSSKLMLTHCNQFVIIKIKIHRSLIRHNVVSSCFKSSLLKLFASTIFSDMIATS